MAPGGDDSRTTGAVRASVLRWLARRPRTETEIRARLDEAGLAPADAEALVEDWRRLGYVDDRRLSYTYLSVRSERRLQGRRRLMVELARRGVPREILDGVAHEAVDDEAEERNLRRLLERRLAVEGVPSDPGGRARLERFLARRGFEEQAVRRALAPYRGEGGEHEFDGDP